MKTQKLCLSVILSFLVTGALFSQAGNVPQYEIKFLSVPPSGSGPDMTDLISGSVTGPDLTGLRIVLYAYAGGKWWIQPTIDEPFTVITSDRKWSRETHLGDRYGALLIRQGYKPPSTCNALPQVGGSIVAVAMVNATNPK